MYIKRTLFDRIQAHLSSPEITLIVGPRQAGKTTLMELLEDDLKKKGGKTIFLRLDIEKDAPALKSQGALIQKISLEIGEEKGYVFIDEIQRKENAGLFLKGLYDMKLPYKFIVSGSGSIELKEKIHESLPGRKRLFELSTLTFEEFVNFKTGYKYTGKILPSFFEIYKEIGERYLKEYLSFGGYPKIVLSETIEDKQAAIDDIYQSFLEKDISILLNIRKSEQLTNLVRLLASRIGNLVNIAEISNTLGLSMPTVREYLWYLEKTYIIRKVTPYFKNVRKEITKAPFFYFVDLGMRNYANGSFNSVSVPREGFLFENYVYLCIKGCLSFTASTVHFWRTQDKAEVDFVINTGLEVIPVEVKYANLKTPQTTRSFKSFISKYKPKKAFIVHLGDPHPPINFKGTKIYFIPYYNCAAILKDT